MTYDNLEERQKKYSPENLPRSLTRKIYIHYETDGRNAGEISLWDADMSGEKRILLHKMMVTADIPAQQDLKTKLVDALQNEIKTVQAETYKKVTELQERIDGLLAIEYKPEEV